MTEQTRVNLIDRLTWDLERTDDDWHGWHDLLPDQQACEQKLRDMGFHNDYEALYQAVSRIDTRFCVIPDSVHAMRDKNVKIQWTLFERALLIQSVKYWHTYQTFT